MLASSPGRRSATDMGAVRDGGIRHCLRLAQVGGNNGHQPVTVCTDDQSLQCWHKEHVDTSSGGAACRARWHETLAKFDLTVVYMPGGLDTVADCVRPWAYPASKGLAHISMHGDEGEQPRPRASSASWMSAWNVGTLITSASSASQKKAPRASGLLPIPAKKASLARGRQATTEACFHNTKKTPPTSCLAEDWEEDYAKSEF